MLRILMLVYDCAATCLYQIESSAFSYFLFRIRLKDTEVIPRKEAM